MFKTLLFKALWPALTVNIDRTRSIRRFTYTLFTIGLIWLSIFIYWFFAKGYVESLSALASSVSFCIIAVIVEMVNCYLKRKNNLRNSLNTLLSEPEQLIKRAGIEVEHLVQNKNFISALSVIAVIIITYKLFSKK